MARLLSSVLLILLASCDNIHIDQTSASGCLKLICVYSPVECRVRPATCRFQPSP